MCAVGPCMYSWQQMAAQMHWSESAVLIINIRQSHVVQLMQSAARPLLCSVDSSCSYPVRMSAAKGKVPRTKVGMPTIVRNGNINNSWVQCHWLCSSINMHGCCCYSAPTHRVWAEVMYTTHTYGGVTAVCGQQDSDSALSCRRCNLHTWVCVCVWHQQCGGHTSHITPTLVWSPRDVPATVECQADTSLKTHDSGNILDIPKNTLMTCK